MAFLRTIFMDFKLTSYKYNVFIILKEEGRQRRNIEENTNYTQKEREIERERESE